MIWILNEIILLKNTQKQIRGETLWFATTIPLGINIKNNISKLPLIIQTLYFTKPSTVSFPSFPAKQIFFLDQEESLEDY